jgi:DNA-binding NarL/FixJ family response regulator
MHRVMVLGEKRFFREALVSMISSAPGWCAFSAGEDEGDGGEGPASTPVDVLLVQTLDGSPVGWVEGVRARYVHAPLVVIGPQRRGAAGSVRTSLAATGYLPSDVELETLLDALRRACSGDILRPSGGPKMAAATMPARRPELTSREAEIVHRLSAAHPSEQIAESLGISANTLRTHLRNIMSKLDAHSRVEIVARARQLGLLQIGAGAHH